MKVLYTGTSFPRSHSDWRGQFIYQIAKMLAENKRIELRTWLPPGIRIGCARNVANVADAAWLENLLERGGIAHLLRNQPLSGVFTAVKLMRRLHSVYKKNEDVDLYHINWLQNALAMGRSNVPAVISVLGTDFKLLGLPGMQFALRRVIQSRQTVITPNADWMVDKLTRMFGDIARIETVEFGVDSRWYQLDRMSPTHTPRIWLVVLRITRAKMGKLFAWGEKIFSGADDELHLFGPMQEQISIPAWVHYHGSTNPSELAESWYGKACGMITLSQHDEGRPQVLLEAMASGLPIIASSISAHKDLIEHNVDGILVDSAADFSAAVTFLTDTDKNTKMGAEGRENMLRTVGTWKNCASKYIKIYDSLVI